MQCARLFHVLAVMIGLISAEFYTESGCLVTQTTQLASTEKAVSIGLEYSLESLSDVLAIYQVLKQMDIEKRDILNRTFYSVSSPLLAEVFLGLQLREHNVSYSLTAGPNDFFIQG